jgi:hypothetical protein
MVLVGIANENEFYSAHYLDAILKQDLKQVAQRWKATEDTGEKSPDRQLGSLSKDYFRLRDQLVKTRDVDEQLALQRDLTKRLLAVLGYDWQPQLKLVADEQLLPIGGSWLLFHRYWLTGLVSLPLLAWMGFFILVFPRLARESGLLAEMQRTHTDTNPLSKW